ncbi:MAG TPA: hypothetical protein VJB05_03570 [archaeon]|nr:hypothetical protein [archaeon]
MTSENYRNSIERYTELAEPLVIYAAITRDRTQGFLHTGDFISPDVETIIARRERRITLIKGQ